jgi:hypothetical protein
MDGFAGAAGEGTHGERDERAAHDQLIAVAGARGDDPLAAADGVTLTRNRGCDGATAISASTAIREPDNRGRVRVLNCEELVGQDRVE